MNTPGIDQYDLSSIKMIISGGAPLPLEVRQDFERRTGGHIVEGYGLSETSPVTCVNPPARAKVGSIGLPMPGTICEVVSLDDRKTVLPPGEIGELTFTGPQVMMGYWNRPDATAETIIDGRLHTGDVGRIDEDGYVFITDRLKEMIIASGFKIYPRNVEEAIYGHPAVRGMRGDRHRRSLSRPDGEGGDRAEERRAADHRGACARSSRTSSRRSRCRRSSSSAPTCRRRRSARSRKKC